MRKKPLETRSTAFPRRFAAVLYDSLLITGMLFPITLILIWIRGGTAFSPGDRLFEGIIALTSWAFHVWFWTHGGQTLGMKAWGIKIEDTSGRSVNAATASKHFLLGVLLCLPFGLGWWWSILDPHHRSLQEILSGTRIVRHRPPGH